MVEVKIPSEIRAYKSKLILGLSTRQFISIAAAISLEIPIGVIGRRYISEDILYYIIILTAAPILAFGFFTFKDMKFEDFIKAFVSMLVLPQKRVYEDTEENFYCSISEEIICSDILQQRIDNGEYEQYDIEGSEKT